MTDIDLSTLTLAALLTTTGATGLAVLVTGLVSVIGKLANGRLAGNEARAAAFIAAVFVGLLAVQAVASGVMTVGVPLVLSVVIGWYAVTRLAMSIHDDAANNPSSLRMQR